MARRTHCRTFTLRSMTSADARHSQRSKCARNWSSGSGEDKCNNSPGKTLTSWACDAHIPTMNATAYSCRKATVETTLIWIVKWRSEHTFGWWPARKCWICYCSYCSQKWFRKRVVFSYVMELTLAPKIRKVPTCDSSERWCFLIPKTSRFRSKDPDKRFEPITHFNISFSKFTRFDGGMFQPQFGESWTVEEKVPRWFLPPYNSSNCLPTRSLTSTRVCILDAIQSEPLHFRQTKSR